MSELTVEVSARERTGKNANRQLRAEQKVPAVVYGNNREAVAIQVGRGALERLLRKGGENAVFLLKLEGTKQSRHAMIREQQLDPRTGEILHIDFLRVDMTQKVRVSVSIELTGTPYGVKTEGGLLEFITREILVECLPGEIPDHLVVDVSELRIGKHVELSDIELPEGVEMVDEGTKVVAAVSAARIEEEEDELDEDEEMLEEGAEPAAEEDDSAEE